MSLASSGPNTERRSVSQQLDAVGDGVGRNREPIVRSLDHKGSFVIHRPDEHVVGRTVLDGQMRTKRPARSSA